MTIRRQRNFKQACLAYKAGLTKPCAHAHCEYCDEYLPAPALCFRHRDASTSNRRLSEFTGSADLRDEVMRELDKTDMICVNCERENYKRAANSSRAKMEAVQLLGGACSFCEYSACAAALEFHHEAGAGAATKKLQISDINMKNFYEVVDEILLCKLICANCHRIHHFEEKTLDKIILLFYNKNDKSKKLICAYANELFTPESKKRAALYIPAGMTLEK